MASLLGTLLSVLLPLRHGGLPLHRTVAGGKLPFYDLLRRGERTALDGGRSIARAATAAAARALLAPQDGPLLCANVVGHATYCPLLTDPSLSGGHWHAEREHVTVFLDVQAAAAREPSMTLQLQVYEGMDAHCTAAEYVRDHRMPPEWVAPLRDRIRSELEEGGLLGPGHGTARRGVEHGGGGGGGAGTEEEASACSYGTRPYRAFEPQWTLGTGVFGAAAASGGGGDGGGDGGDGGEGEGEGEGEGGGGTCEGIDQLPGSALHGSSTLIDGETAAGELTPLRFLLEYVRASRPLIVRGGAARWPAFAGRWQSLAALERRLGGGVPVNVSVSCDGEFDAVRPSSAFSPEMLARARRHFESSASAGAWGGAALFVRPALLHVNYSAYAALTRAQQRAEQEQQEQEQDDRGRESGGGGGGGNSSGTRYYLQYFPMSGFAQQGARELRALHEELRDPAQKGTPGPFQFAPFLKIMPSNWRLWQGSGGTTAKLHFDQFENLLVLLSGRKTFDLFPPSEHRKLGAGTGMPQAGLRYNHSARTCDLDRGTFRADKKLMFDFSPFDLQRDRAALAAMRLRHARCELGPGDILYLPTGWWHEVRTRPERRVGSVSTAISYFFDPYYRLSPNASFFSVSPAFRHVERLARDAEAEARRLRTPQLEAELLSERAFHDAFEGAL